MNIVLKDTEYILSCTSAGFKKSVKKSNWNFWISELSLLDLNPIERYKVELLIKNEELFKYCFDEKEILKVYKLFNRYSNNISVSDASALVVVQKLDDSMIVNRNGIFNKICDKLNIKNNDFDWFFNNLK